MTDDLLIRYATRDDAELIVGMCHRLGEAEGEPQTDFTVADYLEEGFGADSIFKGLIAERNGQPVGYTIYERDYDSDRMQRAVLMSDLFVEASARGLGVGRVLAAATAKAGRDDFGAELMFWMVLHNNPQARAFYRRLGAEEQIETRWFYAEGERFADLARRQPPAGVTLRSARRDDLPTLARFQADLLSEMGEGDLPDDIEGAFARDLFGAAPFLAAVLAEDSNGPLGFVTAWPVYGTLFAQRWWLLSDLYVVGRARGRGTAGALMGEMARRAAAAKAKFLLWPVFASNLKAIAYYERIAEEDKRDLACTLSGDAFRRLVAESPEIRASAAPKTRP